MADKFDQDGKWNFAFIPAFADCIARVASVWARLEYDINVTIWALADTRPALGASIPLRFLRFRRVWMLYLRLPRFGSSTLQSSNR